MGKNIIHRIIFLMLLFVSGPNLIFSEVQTQKLLNDAKKQALKDIKNEEGFRQLETSKEMFDKLANGGNGEAAFILFCYYCFGKYEDYECFYAGYEGQYYPERWRTTFEKGLNYLNMAYNLNYPDAKDYYLIKESLDPNDLQSLSEQLSIVYEANVGDPLKQFHCASIFKDNLNNKDGYLYWIKKSIDNKDWPLWARLDYAYYLLNNGDRDEAFEVIKPTVKKHDYTKDSSAYDFVFDWFKKFYIIDDLYRGNLQKTYEDLGKFYGKDIDIKTIPQGTLDDKSEQIILSNPYASKKLYEIVYNLNRNPSDSNLIYERGLNYENWSDSITAFKYFKDGAYKGNPKAILKTLNYISNGYNCTADSLNVMLDFIIDKDVKIDNNNPGPKRSFLKYGYNDWRVNYVLGEFFYNNKEEYRDYQKAFRLFLNSTNYDDTPEPIRAESARYLFKCYTNGRGVNVNQKKAQEWLNKANSLGNLKSRPIDYLFPSENDEKKPYNYL
ncbi:MAG: sel1 repeat family protein [Muribaculaceae bacterium]|nr:sel1 repeat family protein [Muribaculaceae bacterium]